jgi:hypothetical protein
MSIATSLFFLTEIIISALQHVWYQPPRLLMSDSTPGFFIDLSACVVVSQGRKNTHHQVINVKTTNAHQIS